MFGTPARFEMFTGDQVLDHVADHDEGGGDTEHQPRPPPTIAAHTRMDDPTINPPGSTGMTIPSGPTLITRPTISSPQIGTRVSRRPVHAPACVRRRRRAPTPAACRWTRTRQARACLIRAPRAYRVYGTRREAGHPAAAGPAMRSTTGRRAPAARCGWTGPGPDVPVAPAGTALHRGAAQGGRPPGPGWTGPRPWPVGGEPRGRGPVRADGARAASRREERAPWARRRAAARHGVVPVRARANGVVGVVIFSARRPATRVTMAAADLARRRAVCTSSAVAVTTPIRRRTWLSGLAEQPDIGLRHRQRTSHVLEPDRGALDPAVDHRRRAGRGEGDVDRQTEDGPCVHLDSESRCVAIVLRTGVVRTGADLRRSRRRRP